jgi:hypothetical protein
VLSWGDRLAPSEAPSAAEIARFPYLGDGFELQARPETPPDAAAALARIHLFNWGSTLSQGAVAGDIPGLAVGATRLASAVVSGLFGEDQARHYQRLLAHDEQELLPTRRWTGRGG